MVCAMPCRFVPCHFGRTHGGHVLCRARSETWTFSGLFVWVYGGVCLMRKARLHQIVDRRTTAAAAISIFSLHCPLNADTPEMQKATSDCGVLHEALQEFGLRTDTFLKVDLNGIMDACKRTLASWCWGVELVLCRLRRYLCAVRRVRCFVVRSNFLRRRRLNRMFRWWVEVERGERRRNHDTVKLRQQTQLNAHYDDLLGGYVDCFVPEDVKQLTIYTAYQICRGDFYQQLRKSWQKQAALTKRLKALQEQYRKEERRWECIPRHLTANTRETLANLIMQTADALAKEAAEEPVFRFRPGDIPFRNLVAISKEQGPKRHGAVTARAQGLVRGALTDPLLRHWGMAADHPEFGKALELIADDVEALVAAPGDSPSAGTAASPLPIVTVEADAVGPGVQSSRGHAAPDARKAQRSASVSPGRADSGPALGLGRSRSLDPQSLGGPFRAPVSSQAPRQSLALQTAGAPASTAASRRGTVQPASPNTGRRASSAARGRSKSLEPRVGDREQRPASATARRCSAQPESHGGPGRGSPKAGASAGLGRSKFGRALGSVQQPGTGQCRARQPQDTASSDLCPKTPGVSPIGVANVRGAPEAVAVGAAEHGLADGGAEGPMARLASPIAGALRPRTLSSGPEAASPKAVRGGSAVAAGGNPPRVASLARTAPTRRDLPAPQTGRAGGHSPADAAAPDDRSAGGRTPAAADTSSFAPGSPSSCVSGPQPTDNPQSHKKLPPVAILTRPPVVALLDTPSALPDAPGAPRVDSPVDAASRPISSCLRGAQSPPPVSRRAPELTPLRPEDVDDSADDPARIRRCLTPSHGCAPRWSRSPSLSPSGSGGASKSPWIVDRKRLTCPSLSVDSPLGQSESASSPSCEAGGLRPSSSPFGSVGPRSPNARSASVGKQASCALSASVAQCLRAVSLSGRAPLSAPTPAWDKRPSIASP